MIELIRVWRKLLCACVVLALPATAAASTPAAGSATRVLLSPLPDRGGEDEEAKAAAMAAYEEASRRYEAGDLEAALEAAGEAYRAVPNASTAFVRATILEAMGRPCEAFELLLTANDLDPKPAEAVQISDGLARHGKACAPGFGWARVRVVPIDAALLISGVPVIPGRTIGLRALRHPVEVEASGRTPLRTVLDVRPGEEATASYELIATQTRARVSPPISNASVLDAEEGGPSGSVLRWALVGSGGALLLGGAGMTLLALDAKDEADGYASAGSGSGLDDEERERRYGEANDRVKTRATVSYLLYGAGAAAVATGIVLLTTSSDEPGDRAGMRLQPIPLPHGAGLVLVGAY